MNQILCKVSDEDAKNLIDTIDDANTCKILYDEAKTKMDCNPVAFKIIIEYFMKTQKVHWALWRELLVRCIGEEDASKFFNILKFDPIKKVIFKMDIEGCALCNKSGSN